MHVSHVFGVVRVCLCGAGGYVCVLLLYTSICIYKHTHIYKYIYIFLSFVFFPFSFLFSLSVFILYLIIIIIILYLLLPHRHCEEWVSEQVSVRMRISVVEKMISQTRQLLRPYYKFCLITAHSHESDKKIT